MQKTYISQYFIQYRAIDYWRREKLAGEQETMSSCGKLQWDTRALLGCSLSLLLPQCSIPVRTLARDREVQKKRSCQCNSCVWGLWSTTPLSLPSCAICVQKEPELGSKDAERECAENVEWILHCVEWIFGSWMWTDMSRWMWTIHPVNVSKYIPE